MENAEKRLFEKYIEVKPVVMDALSHLNYEMALEKLIELRPYIDNYFDEVFVMCEDEDLRMNRLGFLKTLDNLFVQIGDLSQVEKI
ncbi:MAG: DALR anticodon-binding domain-containing protein [Fervidobacterium sp.]